MALNIFSRDMVLGFFNEKGNGSHGGFIGSRRHSVLIFYHSQYIKSTPIEPKSLARKGGLPGRQLWEQMGILAP
jgi:hypothetical protein